MKAFGKRIDKKAGATIQFEDVGRHEATTFTGFCAKHDAEVFAPIETRSFDATSPQHRFLAAYRALTKELHAQMEAAYRIQATYNERMRLALDSGDEPEPVGMYALEWMIKSYSSYEYKLVFDNALLANNYQGVLHDVFSIDHDAPAIAVCSHFGLDYRSDSGDWARAALNILPLRNDESIVIFSYLERDAPLVRSELNDVLNSTGLQQKYLLSKRILNHCGNFVVSPAHFDSWSAEKRAAITEYFCHTLLDSHLEIENELLYLF